MRNPVILILNSSSRCSNLASSLSFALVSCCASSSLPPLLFSVLPSPSSSPFPRLLCTGDSWMTANGRVESHFLPPSFSTDIHTQRGVMQRDWDAQQFELEQNARPTIRCSQTDTRTLSAFLRLLPTSAAAKRENKLRYEVSFRFATWRKKRMLACATTQLRVCVVQC